MPDHPAHPVLVLALVLLLGACGKDEAPPPARSAAVPAVAPAPKPKPEPPDLGLPVERFKLARVTELCAAKYGETAEDAKILGLNALLGRPHFPPASKAPPAPGGVVPPHPPAAPPPAATSTGALEDLTPTGRLRPQKGDLETRAKYERAISLLPRRPDVAGPIDKAVTGCLYAPERGLISDQEAERYVQTFVAIACLQIKLRDPVTGRTDPLAHARAAGKVFAESGFSARSFAELGMLMGRFPSVTAKMYTLRRQRCPDPADARRLAAVRGRFVGSFKGRLRGTLSFTAADGGARGELTFTSGPAAKGEPWRLKGAMNPGYLHLFGRAGDDDWIRLEGKPGPKVARGRWEGELHLKKVHGSWTWGRPPPPAPPAKADAGHKKGDAK